MAKTQPPESQHRVSDSVLDLEIGSYAGEKSIHARDVHRLLVELRERRAADQPIVGLTLPQLRALADRYIRVLNSPAPIERYALPSHLADRELSQFFSWLSLSGYAVQAVADEDWRTVLGQVCDWVRHLPECHINRKPVRLPCSCGLQSILNDVYTIMRARS